MILYCDTSALIKLYIQEEGSDAMRAQAAAATALAVSRVTWAESFSALARRAREVPADEPAIELARQRLRGHWTSYMVVEVTQQVVEQAGDFAETFALRAYDSIQLASAHTLHHALHSETGEGIAFACYDSRLRKAALVLGMIDAITPGGQPHPPWVAERKTEGYRIVKEASLRASLRRYQDMGDERWRLFDALLSSTTYGEYMAKVGGFEQERISGATGETWKVTAENCFNYVLRHGRIEQAG